MKHYEVTVNNGAYPLTRMCDSISEAYGCIDELKYWASRLRDIDMCGVMEDLVKMKHGEMLAVHHSLWSVIAREVEG